MSTMRLQKLIGSTHQPGLAKKLPAVVGLSLDEEMTELNKAMRPKSPALFLLGGAKFETKMPLVEKYLQTYDQVFIAGALMNDIFKAKGYEVGESLVSDVSLKGAALLDNPKLILPIDVVVDGPDGRVVKTPDTVLPTEKIMDVGPMTVNMLVHTLRKPTPFYGMVHLARMSSVHRKYKTVAKHVAERVHFRSSVVVTLSLLSKAW